MELADRGIFLIYEHSLILGWDTKSRRHSRRVWIMGYVIGFQYMCVQYLKLLIGWQEGHLACKKICTGNRKRFLFWRRMEEPA